MYYVIPEDRLKASVTDENVAPRRADSPLRNPPPGG